MMEWALLSHRMWKLLELVPGVQCPTRDHGLLFISTSDPDAFTLLRVCHVHKSPALGNLVLLRKNPVEQLASTLLKDTEEPAH